MKVHEVDNSAKGIGEVITWQYDKAYNLLMLFMVMNSYYNAAVADFWNSWKGDILGLDTCNEFGAALWGAFLGVSRPTITTSGNEGSVRRPINLYTYRLLLKAAFCFMNSSSTLRDIERYLDILFCVKPDSMPYSQYKRFVDVYDKGDMAIEYKINKAIAQYGDPDQTYLFEQCGDEVLLYPLGIRRNRGCVDMSFGFRGQDAIDTRDFLYSVPNGWNLQPLQNVTIRTGDIIAPDYTRAYSISEPNESDGSLGHPTLYRYIGNDVSIRTFDSVHTIKPYLTPVLWSGVGEDMKNSIDFRLRGGLCEGNVPEYQVGREYKRGESFSYGGRNYVCMSDISAEQNNSFSRVNVASCYMSVGISRTTQERGIYLSN